MVEYEVWITDVVGNLKERCASSTNLGDAEHYFSVYGQDSSVALVKVSREVLNFLPYK